ncbi:MAG: DNA recombination protein RmuC, partial [Bacteroidota bacterium]
TTLQNLSSQLDGERETNRKQQQSISALHASSQLLEERVKEERETNLSQQQNIDYGNQQILHLRAELSKVETIKSSLEEKIQQQSVEFEAARQKSLLEFENIANRLFEEKSNVFTKRSKENIEQLLSPLQHNLKEFKKKVEETYDKESKERFSLEGKITELVALNQQISRDATNLTNALKGQSKTQGDWGEMLLESILQHSGLVKGREYVVQASFKDEQGKELRPDVLVKYPDDRYIIIDSKVSLTAYEQFANSDDIDQQQLHLNQHIRSIKKHIDDLSSKDYEQLDRALDFVFLFIPIEPAFLTALQYDDQLWNYAYAKRIVLMSPTNLIATLRVIADVWKKEVQNRNAREISARGEKLYDKFVGFITDMEGIQQHLASANGKYESAMKKLSQGPGNLIGQAEKLKKLGINPKKSIPRKLLGDEAPEDTTTGDEASIPCPEADSPT